ncbi:helix-turn-helix domain-containing protein [Rosenbergiella collisarenosi]|uniref:helix-turn-helix domain-containing protein n=1 Tax=Rosenbergiella collisarenosi TaxID=1544695 RepID=UPI001F4ED3D3
MSEINKIAAMAKRYHAHGAITDESMKKIDALAAKKMVPKVRTLSANQIERVRLRANLSQAAMASIVGMSVSSITKWESGKSKPNAAAMRLLNIIEEKGVSAIL